MSIMGKLVLFPSINYLLFLTRKQKQENKSLTTLSTDRVMDLIGSKMPTVSSSTSHVDDQYFDLDVRHFIQRFKHSDSVYAAE